GEAQGDKVLDRLLPEIVVDAEGAVLAEMLADGVADRVVGLEALADRLLDDDAVWRRCEGLCGEAPDDGNVEGGRRRQVEDRLVHPPQLCLERAVAGRVGCVAADIGEALREPGPGFI